MHRDRARMASPDNLAMLRTDEGLLQVISGVTDGLHQRSVPLAIVVDRVSADKDRDPGRKAGSGLAGARKGGLQSAVRPVEGAHSRPAATGRDVTRHQDR